MKDKILGKGAKQTILGRLFCTERSRESILRRGYCVVLTLAVVFILMSVKCMTVYADTATPLTFTAEEAGSTISFSWDQGSDVMVKASSSSVKIGDDNATGSWQEYTAGTQITLSNKNDTVSFKGNNVTTNSLSNHFYMDGKISASGDVTSLTNSIGGAAQLTSACYWGMFYGCSSLTTAPTLPAEILAEGCYDGMFFECSSLTTAPILPAETLADGCYSGMFSYCSGLTTAPTLPATTLAYGCYSYMFSGCSSLTTAPTLPAKTLASNCYTEMFSYCSSLVISYNEFEGSSEWKLPIDNNFDYSEFNMFSGCDHVVLNEENSCVPVGGVTYYALVTNSSQEPQTPTVTAPTKVTAVNNGNNAITVNWDAVAGAKYYALYLKSTTGEITLINNRLTTNSCTVNNLTVGTKVGFVVKAYGNGKWSGWSPTSWVTPMAPVYTAVAPATVTATAGNGSVNVTWSAVPGAKCYALFLKRTNGEVVLVHNRLTTNEFTIPNLPNGTKVGFVVKSYVGSTWSGWSSTAWATPKAPAYTAVAPSNVTTTAGNKTITVTWDAVPGAQLYALYMKKADGTTVLVNSRLTGTTCTLNSLTNGDRYGFIIKSYVAKTWSGWSATAWDTPVAGK